MAGSDAEQFSLRWNNFHSNLVSGFHALLQEVELVDVTLAAEGQFIQAHKIVLSVCSPYFKQLFQVNPCKHPIVILKDVGHKELIAILQFMYQGEVNVRQEELADFLKTAELLQIKGLTGNDNNREPDRTPCTTPQPSPHRQPGSHIRVSDVRSEAHLSEVSQGYPSGNDANIDLASAVSEESASPARPTKRLHSDASVSSSTLSHRKEQKEEEFVQKIPKVEPIDLDLDAEITSDQISPEGLQQFLTNSGKSTHPQQNISAGGNGNSTPAIAQSQLIHPSSISRHGQVSETSVVSVQSASQGRIAYVESPRGAKQLLHQGFLHQLQRTVGSKKYWRCINYIDKLCPGRCVMENNIFISKSVPHNHDNHYEKVWRQYGAKEQC
ncbi:longitudinals lacking protein, isoforms H/M/V-like isoform X5 [Schistocerca piceifrons]|uniref:longitudinals lacking protein, isoforms H/M/V-like isoform X5 n=1 Tax=Schistocerca piceifrons TaxID=274613 RepID=UPI001F5F7155|nr:longitudinals lacking protein, isoforms H/M/V-like isoform X5 [Schistocerca piceifrons]XP_049962570.1 longitudinals lacking protein, isoforms H/M/V-like isoform X7 [Schistocerca serialis cubense]